MVHCVSGNCWNGKGKFKKEDLTITGKFRRGEPYGKIVLEKNENEIITRITGRWNQQKQGFSDPVQYSMTFKDGARIDCENYRIDKKQASCIVKLKNREKMTVVLKDKKILNSKGNELCRVNKEYSLLECTEAVKQVDKTVEINPDEVLKRLEAGEDVSRKDIIAALKKALKEK